VVAQNKEQKVHLVALKAGEREREVRPLFVAIEKYRTYILCLLSAHMARKTGERRTGEHDIDLSHSSPPSSWEHNSPGTFVRRCTVRSVVAFNYIPLTR